MPNPVYQVLLFCGLFVYGKETETQMVWPHLKILGHGEDNSAGDSERSKKERKTEEEMGR